MSKTKATSSKQCEGYRRHGGIFTFGPDTWEQCKETATVMLTVKQKSGNVETLPACAICWNEVIENGIEVIEAKPIAKTRQASRQ